MGKLSCRATLSFLAVVDDLKAAVSIGVDVTVDLRRKVEDPLGVAGGIARDWKGGNRVLDVAADVALRIDHLQSAGGTRARRAGAVGRVSDHDSLGQLARRNRSICERILRELVVIVLGAVAGA